MGISIYILKSSSFLGFSGIVSLQNIQKCFSRVGFQAYMMALNDSLAAKALPWHWDQRCLFRRELGEKNLAQGL